MRYFYNGYVVEKQMAMQMAMPRGLELVKVVEDHNLEPHMANIGSDHLVRQSSLEVLCTDAFKIGDKVQSNVGTLVGHVVAFEMHDNRVVVMSERIEAYNNDRTRYAYKPDEIEHYRADVVTFKPGKKYLLNNVPAIAVEGNDDTVQFFDEKGQLIISGVPRTIKRYDMYYKLGIASVK